MEVDPKRTGVKASLIPWKEPPMDLVDGQWVGPPGAFILGTTIEHWNLCCPGCGKLGGPKEGAKWSITSGSFDDVTTLTLSPSIAKSCCGWHGYLKNGVFESC